MKVTSILKTDLYNVPEILNTKSDKDKLQYVLDYVVHNKPWIKTKVGNGQFNDRMELRSIMKSNYTISYKLENRTGYKLAIFEVKYD